MLVSFFLLSPQTEEQPTLTLAICNRICSITDLDSDEDGYAVSKDNVFVNSNTEITQVGSLTPPYSYT